MSIQVMSLVWKHAKVSGSELLVLLAMADYGNDDGKNIFPAMQTLGDKARLSESQTRRILKKLEKQKLIRLVEMGGWRDGRNWANEYELLIGNIANMGLHYDTSLQDATTLQDATSSRTRDHRGSADATTVLAPVTPQSPLQPLIEPSSSSNASHDDEDVPEELTPDAEWKEVVGMMHRCGVTLNGHMSDEYKDMLKEFGKEPVLLGLKNAADNGKAGILKYVRSCVSSAAKGFRPEQANGHAVTVTLMPVGGDL